MIVNEVFIKINIQNYIFNERIQNPKTIQGQMVNGKKKND